MMGQRMIFAFG